MIIGVREYVLRADLEFVPCAGGAWITGIAWLLQAAFMTFTGAALFIATSLSPLLLTIALSAFRVITLSAADFSVDTYKFQNQFQNHFALVFFTTNWRNSICTMSAVEEALERIKEQKGVEGYVICNSEGAVLRRSNAIVKANAEVIAQSMTKLIQTTINGVRDLNPNDNLKNLRIKTTKKEMLVSHSNEFVVIVIQAWQPAKEEQSHLVPSVQKQPKSLAPPASAAVRSVNLSTS